MSNYKYYDAEVLKETSKAYLLETKQGKFWVPKSLVSEEEIGYNINSKFIPKYLGIEKIELDGEDDGLDILNVHIVHPTVKPKADVNPKAPIKPVQDAKYEVDVSNGYVGTYAEWCDDIIPF